MESYIYFWKTKETYGFLSQWYKSKFSIINIKGDIITFSCAEQYMMYCKAKLFNDFEIARQILATDNPWEIKALGKRVRNFNQKIWDVHKFAIVVQGNYLKFKQDKDLAEKLLNTDPAILVEASPVDPIWGIGLSAASATVTDKSCWPGSNLLGQALMYVRDILTGEITNGLSND